MPINPLASKRQDNNLELLQNSILVTVTLRGSGITDTLPSTARLRLRDLTFID
jgi:hypothetical protein